MHRCAGSTVSAGVTSPALREGQHLPLVVELINFTAHWRYKAYLKYWILGGEYWVSQICAKVYEGGVFCFIP